MLRDSGRKREKKDKLPVVVSEFNVKGFWEEKRKERQYKD